IPGRLLRLNLLCAVFALTALSAGVTPAKPSSYLGMGTQTGTPSGDVRAAIETKRDLTDPVLSPDGVPVGGDNEAERPAIVKELSFNRSMRLGIQERLGRTSNVEMVNMTKDYLARMFGYANVSVYYLSDKDLTSAVRTGQVDFFIAGSDYFAMEQSMSGVEQIASLWPNYAETPSAVSATVFFMKRTADRKAASMPVSTVSGREFIATAPDSLGGWLAGAGELVRRQMATYESLRTRTVFAGQDMPSLLDAVRRDPDLVGMLPACELEALERTGEVDPEEFVIINRRTDDGLTCRHSSEVYPGWVFGAVSGIDPTLKKAVTAVLLAMSGLKYGSEWALPVTNRSVYDLFYVLKIGPYQDLASWSLQRFVREHAEIIALILLMIFFILSYATSLSILVRRRTKALREALSERDRIEAEAVQSRQHIANLERTGIVGQMSTIIAHELKQPLGAIANYGNGLLRRLHRGDIDPKRFEEALQEVVLQADRASKIVERVRSYAKHDYPPRKVADLSI
ncbi:MAG: PhnD/SsuA/transferrin family substrate-binding protein, partial [Sutterella sp.]